MQIASIQMAVTEDDKRRAVDRAVDLIQQCRGADLIILPEIWNIGFMSFDDYYPKAEEPGGQTLSAMQAAARETGAYLHTGSFVEKVDGDYYNSSYLLSPRGEILANYHKIHLFGFNSRETQLLTPGQEVSVVKTPLGTFGMSTCFDLRFPELFRRMVDLGTEIFLVCSAWPYPRLEHWLIFNRARAIENQCLLVSANSVGPNRGATLAGHSMIVDPWGTVMAAGGDEEVIIKTEFDLDRVHEARNRFPGLSGRVDWLQK
ncbi:MAG: carbon-nitrogen family hydrolase [Desulfohalobiaceae bacterium]|nr:carbon-nitrogen family hydrolase [Desulfohalobiaceae bacterium]